MFSHCQYTNSMYIVYSLCVGVGANSKLYKCRALIGINLARMYDQHGVCVWGLDVVWPLSRGSRLMRVRIFARRQSHSLVDVVRHHHTEYHGTLNAHVIHKRNVSAVAESIIATHSVSVCALHIKSNLKRFIFPAQPQGNIDHLASRRLKHPRLKHITSVSFKITNEKINESSPRARSPTRTRHKSTTLTG